MLFVKKLVGHDFKGNRKLQILSEFISNHII